MECAHYNKFTTEYLSFVYFYCYCHKYFKLLKIQYHWVGMNPTHSVILKRLSPDTFYTEQSFKLKTKCDRSLSTMR